MTIFDLFFLASVFLELALLISMAVFAVRGRWRQLRRVALVAGLYVAGYAAVLVSVALATPRRYLAPGERRCFDDWCVTAMSAQRQGRVWIATLEVSSVARRVRQRARDASAEMEDLAGRRYPPCGASEGDMSAELGSGESFPVKLRFCLPANAQPAGLVFHHGDFPGEVIIGDDAAAFHTPALARMALSQGSTALP